MSSLNTEFPVDTEPWEAEALGNEEGHDPEHDPEDAVPLVTKRHKTSGTAAEPHLVHRLREHIEAHFAIERGLLQNTIEDLRVQLESYRSRYWEAQFQLDAILASRRRGDVTGDQPEIPQPVEDEGEVQGAKVLDGVAVLLAKAQACDDAVPQRRFYYPTSASTTVFPAELREGMSLATFRRIVATVKEARSAQSKRKRGQADGEEDEE